MKTIFYLITVTLFLWGCESLIFEDRSYDYSIEQQMGCYCPQGGVWVKLFVTSDTVSKAIRISDEHQLTYNEFRDYKSIKSLFDEILNTDTTLTNMTIIMDSLNYYPSILSFSPKPIIIGGDTVATIEDAWSYYNTKNYKKHN
jgi:hypothetical protein